MNWLDLFKKGLKVLETVWENRELAQKALKALKNIASNQNPTQADMDAADAELDTLLDEFNQ